MKRLKLLLIIIIIIIALTLSNIFGISNFIINVLQKGFGPVQDVTYNFGLKIKSLFSSPSSNELKQENVRLKEKLKNYLIDKIEFTALKQENEYLKQELNFLETIDYNYQIAKIIAQESLFGKKILIINQGTSSGIKEGDPVIISGENKTRGYYLGKIMNGSSATSKLRLITDSKSQTAAKILGQKSTIGIIKGERGLTLNMELIPISEKIKKGDLVITSGLENKIPEGLIIGEVEEIISLPGDLFSKAKIKSFIDFDNLKIVTVLLPTN